MEHISEDQFDEFDSLYGADEDDATPVLEQDVVDDRYSFPTVNSKDNDNSDSRPEHNITASDDSPSNRQENIISSQDHIQSKAEQFGGDEDEKEEENAVTQSDDNQLSNIAGSRQARSRWWPARSDGHQVYSSLQQRKGEIGNAVITLGQGQDSGRNRLAIFHDTDNEPRLAFNIRVTGLTRFPWKGYPSPEKHFLPVGVSLSGILAHYPNHVWNDGLRLFMAEGWEAEKMWKGMPIDARHDGAKGRPHNYLQQALGREADKVGQEQFGEKRVPNKRG